MPYKKDKKARIFFQGVNPLISTDNLEEQKHPRNISINDTLD